MKLYTLQRKLVVKGEFRATIRNDTCGRLVTFVVVFGRIKSPPLIGKETLLGLGKTSLQSTVTCLRALERWKTRNEEKRS